MVNITEPSDWRLLLIRRFIMEKAISLELDKKLKALLKKKSDIEVQIKGIKAIVEKDLDGSKGVGVYNTASFVDASIRESVDLKALRKTDPDVYDSLDDAGYIKRSDVKPHYRWSANK